MTRPTGIPVYVVSPSTNSPPFTPPIALYLAAIFETTAPCLLPKPSIVPTNNLDGSLTIISLPLYVAPFTSTI